jgi:hypothetical protein
MEAATYSKELHGVPLNCFNLSYPVCSLCHNVCCPSGQTDDQPAIHSWLVNTGQGQTVV